MNDVLNVLFDVFLFCYCELLEGEIEWWISEGSVFLWFRLEHCVK